MKPFTHESEPTDLETCLLAKSALDGVPSSVVVLDRDGVIISTNESWHGFVRSHFFACDPIEVGDNYLTACAAVRGSEGENAAHLADGIRRVLAGNAGGIELEFPRSADHGDGWFSVQVKLMAGDGPSRVVLSHRDVSHRKQKESAISELNRRLEMRVDERTRDLREAHEHLQNETAERRRLEKEILEISERERHAIGRDLHDDLNQQIAGAWLLSDSLANALEPRSPSDAKVAAAIAKTLGRAMALTRSLVRGLQPVPLESGGLMVALSELAARTSEMFRIRCRFTCPMPVVVQDNTVATHLYRIAQESVTNAVKHGQAAHIEIVLASAGPMITLRIADNGSGMPDARPRGDGMGLRIMHYRAGVIGGSLSIRSGDSRRGTEVTCTLQAPEKPSPEEP